MIRGRRIALAVILLGALLLAGRVVAVLYGQYTWFSSLNAATVWTAHFRDAGVIRAGLGIFAGTFALANLAAIRYSIISLALPRRLGNVEFGEAVPQRYLNRVVLVLALAVGLLLGLAAPRWTLLAMARLQPVFGQTDPYYKQDLGFYTAWLPLESALYMWSVALLTTVTALVAGLYSLTPGLRWYRGRLLVSTYTRRHITVLGSLALLLLAWSYRLNAYGLLIRGSGSNGVFSYVDHKWLAPTYLFLALGSAAASVLILIAGWTGKLKTGFLTVTAVLVVSFSGLKVLPFLLRQTAPAALQRLRDQPYAQTRALFTRLAFAMEGSPANPPMEIPPPRSSLDSTATEGIASRYDGVLVYPGAFGAVIVGDSSNMIAAPGLQRGFRRLLHAWNLQDMSLLSGDLPKNAKVVGVRDVRARVMALAPVFAQGSFVVPLFRGDTLYWSVDLYSASDNYPLSAHYRIAGADRSYFHHAATAVVHSATGAVTLFPEADPDPIAKAWITRFPSLFMKTGSDWRSELSTAPPTDRDDDIRPQVPTGDSTFRARTAALYNRMRAALAAGNLAAFGAAFDTLGILVSQPRR